MLIHYLCVFTQLLAVKRNNCHLSVIKYLSKPLVVGLAFDDCNYEIKMSVQVDNDRTWAGNVLLYQEDDMDSLEIKFARVGDTCLLPNIKSL